jgi:hypothetical protein
LALDQAEETLPPTEEVALPPDDADSVVDPPSAESEPVETRVHPSAAVNETPVAPEGVDPEYFIGMWAKGIPLYGCPYCPQSTIDGPGDIELHILAKIDAGDFNHRKALEPKE